MFPFKPKKVERKKIILSPTEEHIQAVYKKHENYLDLDTLFKLAKETTQYLDFFYRLMVRYILTNHPKKIDHSYGSLSSGLYDHLQKHLEKSLQYLPELKKYLDDLEKYLFELKSRLSEISNKKNQIDQEIKDIKQLNNPLNQDYLQKLQADLSEKMDKNNELAEETINKENEIAEISKEITKTENDIQYLTSVCPKTLSYRQKTVPKKVKKEATASYKQLYNSIVLIIMSEATLKISEISDFSIKDYNKEVDLRLRDMIQNTLDLHIIFGDLATQTFTPKEKEPFAERYWNYVKEYRADPSNKNIDSEDGPLGNLFATNYDRVIKSEYVPPYLCNLKEDNFLYNFFKVDELKNDVQTLIELYKNQRLIVILLDRIKQIISANQVNFLTPLFEFFNYNEHNIPDLIENYSEHNAPNNCILLFQTWLYIHTRTNPKEKHEKMLPEQELKEKQEKILPERELLEAIKNRFVYFHDIFFVNFYKIFGEKIKSSQYKFINAKLKIQYPLFHDELLTSANDPNNVQSMKDGTIACIGKDAFNTLNFDNPKTNELHREMTIAYITHLMIELKLYIKHESEKPDKNENFIKNKITFIIQFSLKNDHPNHLPYLLSRYDAYEFPPEDLKVAVLNLNKNEDSHPIISLCFEKTKCAIIILYYLIRHEAYKGLYEDNKLAQFQSQIPKMKEEGLFKKEPSFSSNGKPVKINTTVFLRLKEFLRRLEAQHKIDSKIKFLRSRTSKENHYEEYIKMIVENNAGSQELSDLVRLFINNSIKGDESVPTLTCDIILPLRTFSDALEHQNYLLAKTILDCYVEHNVTTYDSIIDQLLKQAISSLKTKNDSADSEELFQLSHDQLALEQIDMFWHSRRSSSDKSSYQKICKSLSLPDVTQLTFSSSNNLSKSQSGGSLETLLEETLLEDSESKNNSPKQQRIESGMEEYEDKGEDKSEFIVNTPDYIPLSDNNNDDDEIDSPPPYSL